jgi:hypothetical protein
VSAVVMMEPALVPLPGFEPEGPTLEQMVAGTWATLGRHQAAACPVCGTADMVPEYGAHALPIGGRCGRCGSELR